MAGGSKSANKEIAAACLARGGTVADAAALASVDTRTVSRWKNEPPFRVMVADLRRQVVGAAVAKISAAMTRAADALDALLGSANESIRLRAAAEIFANGLKATELADIKLQLDELREQIESKSRGR